MKRLKGWFANKLSSAKESAGDVGQLVSWLAKRANNGRSQPPAASQPEPAETKNQITAQEVRQFFGWLNARMFEAKLDERERRELDQWLKARLISSNPQLRLDSEKAEPGS